MKTHDDYLKQVANGNEDAYQYLIKLIKQDCLYICIVYHTPSGCLCKHSESKIA